MRRGHPVRVWLQVCFWAAFIFATSSTWISRQYFIDFVSALLPPGVPHDLWVNFWAVFGLLVVKTYHALEYLFLTTLGFTALNATILRSKRRALAAACTLAALYAVSDEWHQTFIPARGGTWVDVMIDCLGITGAAVIIISRARRTRKSVEPETDV